jgi:hypothetical protein
MPRPTIVHFCGVSLGLVITLAAAGVLGTGVLQAGPTTADESTVSTARYRSTAALGAVADDSAEPS